MGDDVAAIEAWAQIFTSPTNLVADVTKHLVLHRSKIMGELHEVEADWSAGQYMAAGKEAALLMTDAVGPIQTAKSTPENLDLLMVPEIAAGFVYGMVGDNHLAEMESCYQGVQPLWTHLEAALKDVESFHLLGAMKEFEAFVYHFQEDVAPCMAMSEDVAAIEAWAQIFKNPTSLVSTATKHYLLHKKAVTADITAVKADYANKSYFSVGKDAADLLTVLVGPIQ
jgi:inactivated superfamily I helicase